MSEYSMDNGQSKIDSFYTIDDSEFEGGTKRKKNQFALDESQKLNLKVKEYQKIVKKAHVEFGANKMFEDNMFPAINASLFENAQDMKCVIDEVKHISWVRPSVIDPDCRFYNQYNILENKEIAQGLLSNQNFCNALLMIPWSVIPNLLVDVHNMDMGYVSFNFFKNGEWRYVIVDTLIPYSHQNKSPLYSFNSNSQLFFIALLEKAYAKLNGGYDKIANISVEDIVVDFTNGIFTKINFSDNDDTLVSIIH